MLDIQFIRDNPELVAEKAKQKGYPVDVPKLLELDKQRRAHVTQIEELRQQRNAHAQEMKGGKPTDAQLEAGRALKEQLAKVEAELQEVESAYLKLLNGVPNMPLDAVPVGASEDDNVVIKEVGDKPQFDFQPKTHWQLAETRGLIDKERAGKVTGTRFAYIKGDLALLQFAIIQFVMQRLTDERVVAQLVSDNNLNVSTKPFIPVLPPQLIKTEIFDAMDRLEPREDRYQAGPSEDELWLQGSAEHVLGPIYKDEILDERDLPIRYLGYATSYRREAGNYGKDTEGIIRMHQFDKMEMEIFSTPETGLDEHKLACAVQEYLMQQFKLPYRILQKCTYDIGKPNAIGVDVDVWLPGHGRYLETHTADYMTDYQARRLKTRVKRANDKLELVHMNDATAFALGRCMVGIIENYQTADGHIRIPDVLVPYMAGKTQI